CWRLARRLGDDLGWQVRLWVDELHSFARLAPALDTSLARQYLGTIEVVHWNEETLASISLDTGHSAFIDSNRASHHSTLIDSNRACFEPGDLVIEAFACDPPAAFVAAMKVRPMPPVWINLEYLSAESWVASFHAQASLRSDGLRKTFFFPGFGSDTGGLLREPGLLAIRDVVQHSPASRLATLRAIGLPQVADAIEAERFVQYGSTEDSTASRYTEASKAPRLASLFCYPSIDLRAIFEALAQTGPWIVAIAHGVAVHAEAMAEEVNGGLTEPNASPPALHIERFGLLSQPDYDRLLWCADLNVVRGEDSFVRAQWAARPMLWNIYPQEEGAHRVKLDAWLDACDCPAEVARVMQAMNPLIPISTDAGRPPLGAYAASLTMDEALLNPGETSSGDSDLANRLTSALRAPRWQAWQTQATEWSARLGEMSDLADNLIAHYALVANSR
ncbi:MAG: elongation factor P maturation arginine rhamnosyltransferase EarP, partial [Burkholderiaceae bacterium]|nr:elongation factor P maturation arginine rhamnosyltransferase EarP [Burkholderiaceae bacterium]